MPRIVKDYPEPQVGMTQFGGPGACPGLDRLARVVDHRWSDYNGTADLDRKQHGDDRARAHPASPATSVDGRSFLF